MELPLFLFIVTGLIFGSTSVVHVVDSIGINYGQIANNLPTPEHVVPLMKSIGATKVKLYDADPKVLHAFANTGIEFVVAIGNEFLSKMKSSETAQSWVQSNVQPFLPSTKITCITVGNEVLTFNDTTLTSNLLPAMESVHTALTKLGLEKQVSVTSAHSLAVLETSYPPSSGSFRRDLREPMSQILSFHAKTGSPLLINAYPFFAYKGDPKRVPLDYVLFQANQGTVDPVTKLRYENMLFAQVDAVYSALASMGFKKVEVKISETGWPSKGDEDEVGASPENAMKYNGNLMRLMNQKKGTPMRPGYDLDVYFFALFNENLKPGPTSERNYGLFKPDGTPAYQLQLAGINGGSNSNSNSTSGVGGGDDDGSSQSSTTGYLSISSATTTGSFGFARMGLGSIVFIFFFFFFC